MHHCINLYPSCNIIHILDKNLTCSRKCFDQRYPFTGLCWHYHDINPTSLINQPWNESLVYHWYECLPSTSRAVLAYWLLSLLNCLILPSQKCHCHHRWPVMWIGYLTPGTLRKVLWQPRLSWGFHDDVKTWISSLHYWPFVRGIHQWLVDSPHKWPVMQRAFLSSLVDSPHEGLVMQRFDGFGVVDPSKLLNKKQSCWWFEMPWNSCDITVMNAIFTIDSHPYGNGIFPKRSKMRALWQSSLSWDSWRSEGRCYTKETTYEVSLAIRKIKLKPKKNFICL